MINDDILFILGAGASKPYGYPTGEELRVDICKNFANRIFNYYRPKISFDNAESIRDESLKFTKIFSNSSTLSIDLFLARNSIYSDIGKKAICFSILEAEKNSKFRENMKEKNQDWYSYLFKIMTNNLSSPDSYQSFGENKVAFITFNYDRSLEYFFYESLSNSFSLAPHDVIVKELEKIRIYHVYGIIDKLTWQGGSTPYRGPYKNDYINKLKDNIKIIYEKNNSNITELKTEIIRAKIIFSLGFAYAPENLNLLDIPRFFTDEKQVYGTAFCFTKNEILKIKDKLSRHNRIKAIIEDLDCINLLRNYL